MSRKKTSKTTAKSQPNQEKGSNRALYDQIDHLKQENNLLEKENKKLHMELVSKNGELIKLRAEIRNLIDEKTSILGEYQASQIESAEERQKIIELKKENNKLVYEQERLKKEIYNANEQIKNSIEDAQTNKTKLQGLIRKLTNSEQANESLKLRIDQTQKESETERKTCEDLSEQLEKTKEINERLTEDLSQINKERDKVNRELQTTYTDLERSRKDYQALYALQVQTESEKDQTRIDERWQILEILGALLARSHRTTVTEKDPQERLIHFQRQIMRAVGDIANDKPIFFPDKNNETIELDLSIQSLEQLVEWYDWAPSLPFEKSSGVKRQLFRLLHPGIQLGERVLIRARLEPILAEGTGTTPIEDK